MRRVQVYGYIDVGSHLMKDRVDYESGLVYRIPGRLLNLTVLVHEDQVGCLHQAKVFRVRI
jgi:hypothetical protein